MLSHAFYTFQRVSDLHSSICEIKDLRKCFAVRGGVLGLQIVSQLRAVDGVSLNILKGETLGLVGESGCGKTTLSRCILGILPPTSGEVQFMGHNILNLKGEKLRNVRRQIGAIFQDPFTSMTPTMTVEDIVGEPLMINHLASKYERRKIVQEMLENVGLSSTNISRYPHEFSGGQRQRIAIARALVSRPKFLVADEPVAALDVSIRAEVLNLMVQLQKDLGITSLFISHDLSVVRYISDRVAVMYLGKIVEIAQTEELFEATQHPYTKALISAIPIPDPTVKKDRIILSGEVPTPLNPPSGCPFHTRCFQKEQACEKEEPELIEVGENHFVSCLKLAS